MFAISRGQLVEFNILSTFVYGILQSRVFSIQVNSECFRCCKCNNRGCNLVQITDWFTAWWILFTSVVWVSLFIFMGWFWICSPDENCFISVFLLVLCCWLPWLTTSNWLFFGMRCNDLSLTQINFFWTSPCLEPS